MFYQVTDTSKHQTAARAGFETAEARSNTSPTEAKGCIPVESSTRCPAQPRHGPLPLQDHSERGGPVSVNRAPLRTSPPAAPAPPRSSPVLRHRPRTQAAFRKTQASPAATENGSARGCRVLRRGPGRSRGRPPSRAGRAGASAGLCVQQEPLQAARSWGGQRADPREFAAARQLGAHGEGNGAVSRLEQFQP